MSRLISLLSLVFSMLACMTEADKKLWGEFRREIKSDKATKQPSEPASPDAASATAPAQEEGERMSVEAAFENGLNAH